MLARGVGHSEVCACCPRSSASSKHLVRPARANRNASMSYMYLEGGMGYGGTASSVQGDLVGGESMFRPFRSYSDVLAMEDNSYMAGLQRAGFSVDGQGAAAAEPLPLLAGACEDLRMPDAVPVFVMLPLDTINAEGVFRYASVPWFTTALQLLANSGVHGVAVDVWWSAVERSPRCYNWTGYRQLLEVLRATGLKLQAVLSFHACGGNVGDLVQIPLPEWVLQAGQQDPDIFFTDRPRQGAGLGQRNKEYISFWADEEPVLYGRSPIQCYEEFMASFADAFSGDLGGLIEEVVIGMGPCGELRFPSYVEANGWRFPGVGEFQCYDRRALASLAAAARARGHPEWGYAGPHDSGEYNSSPHDTGFFAADGSWGSAYGDFFLSWYSGALLAHGERLLGAAARTLGRFQRPFNYGAAASGQLPSSPLGHHGAQAQALLQRIQSLISCGGETPTAAAAAAAAAGGSFAGLAAGPAAPCGVQLGASDGGLSGTSSVGVPGGVGSRSMPAVLEAVCNAIEEESEALAEQQQQQQHQPLSSGPLESWGSGSSGPHAAAGDGSGSHHGSNALSALLSRLGLGGGLHGSGNSNGGNGRPRPRKRASSSSSCSGSSGASAAPEPGGCGCGAASGGAGTSGGSGSMAQPLLGSVVSLDSLASGSAVGAAACGAAGAPADPLQRCGSPLPPLGARGGAAGAGLVLPLAGLLGGDGRSTSTLTDSVDASSNSAVPTPQGALTPKRGGLSNFSAASVGSLSPDAPADAAAALADAAAAAVQQATAAAQQVAAQQVQRRGSQQGADAEAEQGLLEMFLGSVSGMGADVLQRLSSVAAAVAQQAHSAGRFGAEGLTLTVKIAGVHWWYNSSSHASELTAGYYNTTTRDGYTPLLELCARHGANVTLTCVEMCDAQHPRHAQCGPEGLLRQIRRTAASLGVCLSGENALRIFLPDGGIDATALDRIVSNTRAWALTKTTNQGFPGQPLRSCSSWPCAPMREQQLVQQQYAYPGQYALAGGTVADAQAAGTGRGQGQFGGSTNHRAHSEMGYMVDGYGSGIGGSGSYSAVTGVRSAVGAGCYGSGGSYHAGSLAASSHGGSSGALGTISYGSAAVHASGSSGILQAGMGYGHGSGSWATPHRSLSPLSPMASGAVHPHHHQQQWQEPHDHHAHQQQHLPPQQQQQAYHYSYQQLSQLGVAGGASGSAARGAGGGNGSSNSLAFAGGGGGGGSSSGSGSGSGDVILPPMRAFTFLRLGPEILTHQGPWMRFMYKMTNGRT